MISQVIFDTAGLKEGHRFLTPRSWMTWSCAWKNWACLLATPIHGTFWGGKMGRADGKRRCTSHDNLFRRYILYNYSVDLYSINISIDMIAYQTTLWSYALVNRYEPGYRAHFKHTDCGVEYVDPENDRYVTAAWMGRTSTVRQMGVWNETGKESWELSTGIWCSKVFQLFIDASGAIEWVFVLNLMHTKDSVRCAQA